MQEMHFAILLYNNTLLERAGPLHLTPHNKIKAKLYQLIRNCFLCKNVTQKYKFLVIGKQDTYFVRHHSYSPYKYSEADIKGMLGFLIDNIYVVFGNQVF